MGTGDEAFNLDLAFLRDGVRVKQRLVRAITTNAIDGSLAAIRLRAM